MLRIVSYRIRFVFLVSVLFASPLGAQQAAPWEGASFAADPASIIKAATDIKTDKLYDAVSLLEQLDIHVDADGRATQRWRLVYRVDSTQGVTNWGTVSAVWQPWRQKRPVVTARVITADGVAHPLDPKTLTDSPTHQNSTNTFDDNRVVRGPLPAVAVGAVVEEEVVLEDTAPFLAGGILGRQWFARRVPTQHFRLDIWSRKSVPVRYEARLLPNLKMDKKDEGDLVHLSFENGPSEALDKTPPNLPGDVFFAPQIEFTTFPSWKQIAASYAKLSDPQIRPAEVQSLVDANTKPNDTRAVKIAKLNALLHHEIRYTGIEFAEAALVPQPPSEVLRRKYGDCKDKATMLVSMLRAAGIPANLALLGSGTGQDVSPSLPGAQLFNHAIVYVPGPPDLWIDATDEFSAPGSLPIGDQGRLALIIRENTTALQRIPSSTAADNLLVEKRQFLLSEFGPAHIIEESESHGYTDRSYRSSYGTKRDAKELRKEMEDYAKGAYLTKEFGSVEVGNGYDLSQPFLFRIDVTKGQRGNTTLRDASVAIFLSGIASRLPEYFRTEPEDKGKKSNSDKPEKPRTEDFVLVAPFITEWQYKIVPPPGFKLRAARSNRTQPLGPASLSQEYKVAADGTVFATFRFDTGKQRYTAAEAEALRKAILELRKSNAIMIAFDQVGHALLSSGKVREAVASYDELIARHPKEALHHVQVAYALLEAGIGEAAREEAYEAVRLEPESQLAHETLGWILQHDLVGRRFKKGFEWEKSLAEYKKALEINPEDDNTRTDYAILLEHNADGQRYGKGARLAEAIEQYEELKKRKATWEYLDNNLLYAMYHSGKFEEIEEALTRLDATPQRNALAVAAAAVLRGYQAGLDKSLELTQSEAARGEVLKSAAMSLLELRRYDAAPRLLAALNSDISPETIEALRKTKRYEEMQLSEKDPEAFMRKYFILTIGPSAPDPAVEGLYVPLAKKHIRDGEKAATLREVTQSIANHFHNRSGSDLPLECRGDLALSQMHMTVEGNDKYGYRVLVQTIGVDGLTFYIVKEAGAFRMLPYGKASTIIGSMIRKFVEHDDLDSARKWLDWQREEIHLQTTDDPVSGNVTGRLWKKGQNATKQAILVATASLMLPSVDISTMLPVLKGAAEKPDSGQEALYINVLIASLHLLQEDWADARLYGEKVLKAAPDSEIAFYRYTHALAELKDWATLDAAVKARLNKDPKDAAALDVQIDAAERRADFQLAMKLAAPALNEPKPRTSLLNNYGWDSLFVDPIPNDATEAVHKAVRLTENEEWGVVHTLAALYAETGHTADAHKLIMQVLENIDEDEPNGNVWYVIGRIAEQYGRPAAAVSAYKRVELESARPNSTYELAQKRLRVVAALPQSTPVKTGE